MKRIILWPAGALIFLVGVAGLVLPIIPGWVLIFFGASMIAPGVALKLRKRIVRKVFKSEEVLLDEWKKLPVIAGFTTRHFPLCLRRTKDLADPAAQQKLHSLLHVFSARQQPPQQHFWHFVYLNQVHGDQVACLEQPADLHHSRRFTELAKTDAVITNIPQLVLLVMTADCLSIFFYAGKGDDPRISKGHLWVGVAHAGWRGTYQEIAKKTVRLLCEKSECSPRDVRAVFGPSIGPKAYEVGEEFGRYFPAGHPSHRALRHRGGRWTFDLVAENRRQLVEAGLRADRIQDQGVCTYADREDFYSF
ncbi:MAG: peptidoglycan editing factor PgeF, partial [Candidatus Omnitrophota bacterium]